MRTIPLTLKLLVIFVCLTAWAPASAADNVFPSESPGLQLWLPNLVVNHQSLVVDPKDRQASLAFYNDIYLASLDVESQWTGAYEACDAGATSPLYRDAVRLRINYYRAMAGVPANIMLSPKYNAMAQQAALMMSRNRDLDHSPPVDWECYTAEGATATSRSNLSIGRAGAETVTGQMEDEGTNNYAAGHRRWILYPQSTTFGTGDVPGTADYTYWPANALWVLSADSFASRPETRDGFVAWPPPGFVPRPLAFRRWSFSYDNADFGGTTVRMTMNGKVVPVTLEPIKNGYGENTLVWIPEIALSSLTSAQDHTFTVDIRNVQLAGETESFTYSVIVFDPS